MSRADDPMQQELEDVAAALEAIRAAVRRNAGYQAAQDVPLTQRSNEMTELADLAVISAHLPVSWSTPLAGRALALSKRGMRILLRWYINPIVDQQNAFNEALVRTVATLDERLRELEHQLAQREPDSDA